jgi:hypothetical protein
MGTVEGSVGWKGWPYYFGYKEIACLPPQRGLLYGEKISSIGHLIHYFGLGYKRSKFRGADFLAAPIFMVPQPTKLDTEI